MDAGAVLGVSWALIVTYIGLVGVGHLAYYGNYEEWLRRRRERHEAEQAFMEGILHRVHEHMAEVHGLEPNEEIVH